MNDPRIGIIGGSGLYQIDGLTRPEWVSMETPFGPPSDEFLTGVLEGREVVFLARHARSHRILPNELNHRANLWAMRRLNVRWILSVSAVGSLQAAYPPREIVVIDQFFDRTKRGIELSFFGNGIVAHVSMARPICEDLRQILLEAAREHTAGVHDRGTYVNIEGPAFSTRAESEYYRHQGFDVIGMTNLGEAKCAREAEISYATLAMVTDYDCWKEDEEHVSVAVVLDNLKRNAELARNIIRTAIPKLPRQPNWPTHRSLENALLTPPEHWPASTMEMLQPLLAPYLPRQ